jgi:exodeoxyribonuclease VII small subunit
MSETIRFGEELERLEGIVRELEANDADLDRALTLFEEGVERLRRARALLTEAEQKVKELGSARVD